MDPNATLAEIRRIIARAESAGKDSRMHEYYLQDHDADRLCELVADLDRWLSMGGFMPAGWNVSRSGK